MKTLEINSHFGPQKVSVEQGKNITILMHRGEEVNKTFKIGDTAEYDSYNLSYLGQIISITDKTVSIKPRFADRVRRLKIGEFVWRNYNFDFEETTKRNIEISYSI
jgi:hypothetical protein